MRPIHTTEELQNFFFVPILFNNNGVRTVSITLEFFDVALQNTFRETFSLAESEDEELVEMPFVYLQKYLQKDSSVVLTNLLQTVIRESNLYDDSLHRLTITFTDAQGNNAELLRFFTICALSSSTSLSSISRAELAITGPSCLSSVVLNEPNVLSFDTYLVVRCKYSDVLISQCTITEQTNFFHEQKDISNYDMDEVATFVLAKFSDGSTQLVTYNTISERLILKPSYSLKTAPIEYDEANKIKTMRLMLTLECPVFDGIHTIDYGSFFYRNGMKIDARNKSDKNSNPTIMFNRLMGLKA